MKKFTLGLDLGSASIGWAVVERGERVIGAGVRIFDPGVDLEAFTKGVPNSSNNVVRRMARLQRRQLRRRAARQRELFELLQKADLLPGPTVGKSQERHELLERFDAELRERWSERLRVEGMPEQSLIYLLRAQAVKERLEKHEVGRVFYQFAQRRGFKSNRRMHAEENTATSSEKKEAGVVKEGIQQLEAAMKSGRDKSLGAYFCRLSQAGEPVRRQWTKREWFIQEFEAIWEQQATHHREMTSNLKKEIARLLFFQRPVAANSHLIGKCELELNRQRAPKATLLAQRFRYLQKLNDLELSDGPEKYPLSEGQRKALIEAFETRGDLKFGEIRDLLKLRKSIAFNLERGGDKKLSGNRTNAAMLRAIPGRWPTLSPDQQAAVVQHWIDADDDENLATRLTRNLHFTQEEARAMSSVYPEDGYCNLSIRAMEKLIGFLQDGVPFKTAEATVYGTRFSGGEERNLLRAVNKALPRIPNPAVVRALTELRKVVNAVIKQYGKPAEIRIELARELKRNAKQRQNAWKGMREREAEKKKAAERILKEAGRTASWRDIERVLLYEEGKEVCAYCGEAINFQRLFEGDVEADHILPRSLFPDDSFGNRCICCRKCNQQKLGRTPFQAFGADDGRWAEILMRVASWGNHEKLDRFKIQDLTELDVDKEGSFAARRLNDTRYVSTQAARYLGELYGGRDRVTAGGEKKRAIFASSGMLTAGLRRGWGLEAILRDAEPAESSAKRAKPRHDHRHHAIDAIVIALSSNVVIQEVSAAAASVGYGEAERGMHRVRTPWGSTREQFVESIRPVIEEMRVSHRPNRKLNGQLHDETIYSSHEIKVMNGKQGAPQLREELHQRKPVHMLTKGMMEKIVDEKVKEAVKEKLAAVGGEAKKLEADCPMLKTRSGKEIPIRRVRVRVSGSALKMGQGEKERHVQTGGNHHVAIFEVKGKKGESKWAQPGVMTRLDAMRAKPKKLVPGQKFNLVKKQLDGEPEARFLFSLMGRDMVEMDDAKLGRRNLFVVRTVSDAELTFVRHTEARILTELKRGSESTSDLLRITSIDNLRQWNCRKVFVDVLGRVRG